MFLVYKQTGVIDTEGMAMATKESRNGRIGFKAQEVILFSLRRFFTNHQARNVFNPL